MRVLIAAILLSYCPLISFSQFGEQNLLNGYAAGAYDFKSIDIDDDGDLDLVSASFGSGGGGNGPGITWYENLGGEVFSTYHVISNTIDYAGFVYCEDLDNDGDKDFAFVARFSDKMGWYENLGGGEFGELNLIDDENELINLAILDFDDDGDLDIFSGSRSGNETVYYENLGGGEFSDQNILSVDFEEPKDIMNRDMDNDGDEDIIITYREDETLGWYENLGGGSFSDLTVIHESGELVSKYFISIADLDLDGDLEIVGSSNENKLFWFDNLGDGDFSDINIISGETGNPGDVNTGDLTGEGYPEILIPSWSDSLGWRENMGDGTFGSINYISEGSANNTVYCTDLDMDGTLDVLSNPKAGISYFRNTGGGVFEAGRDIYTRIENTRTVLFEDVNDDGLPDIISAGSGYTAGKVIWYKAYGDNKYESPRVLSDTVSGAWGLFAIDFDLDGDKDIVASEEVSDRIVWFENLGGDNFSGAQLIVSGLNSVRAIHCVDMNGDGDIDVVASVFWDHKIIWFENSGTMTFEEQHIIFEGDRPNGFDIKDIDSDGDLDVALINFWNSNVYWSKNLGGGDFEVNFLQDIGHQGVGAHIADINHDGNMDILASSYEPSRLGWFRNLGGGEFSSYQIISDDLIDPNGIETADLDLDGDLDVICASDDDYKVTWFENIGGGDFGDENVITTETNGAYFIATGDVDNDGDMDLVSSSWYDSKVAWYENLFFNPKQVRGELYYDENENGIRDPLETGLSYGQVLSDPDATFSFAYENGKYFMNYSGVEEGIYEVFPDELDYWYITSDSLSYHVSIDDDFSFLDSADFGMAPVETIHAVDANLVGAFPRCNNIINYWLSITNEGTTFPSGVICLTLDDEIAFHDAEIVPDSIVGQNIYWHYNDIYFFSDFVLNLEVEMPDFELMGDTLSSLLNVYVDSADVSVLKGIDTLNQVLVCAYDPNDKSVDPKGIDDLGFVPLETDEFEYLIRFQNTGTDTAINVVITDQLDTNLTWSDVEILAHSHAMETTFDPSGELKFSFLNIMLPDSNVNQLASHGFVKYRINAEEGLPSGTSIYNTANIFFDENPPITTNTVTNTLYDCNGLFSQLVLDSGLCENYVINGELIEVPSSGLYTWIINEEDEYLGSSFEWLANASGSIPISLNITTPFCSADTLFMIEVIPEIKTNLDSQYICQGDGLIIFDEYRGIAGTYYDTLIAFSGCDSILVQELIVYDLPEVNFNELEDETLCLESGAILLGGTPESGIFYGTGVSGDEFNPNIAGEGEHILYYSFEDGNGCSDIDSVMVNVVDCLGVDENNPAGIRIYPNPFTDHTTISFEQPLTEKHVVVIHNAIGQEVYRNENVIGSSLKIEKGQLGTGVYVLFVFNSDLQEVFSTKLLVE